MNKLSIIIPVFNEKDTLLLLLEKVDRVDLGEVEKEVIIIDDGSIDGTREILAGLPEKYKIILQDKNYGKGFAIRRGLKDSSGNIIIIQDADLEYDPEDYIKLINPIINQEVKVVYGSRTLGENKWSSFSFYWGGQLLSFLVFLFYRVKITDEPTCYKVFSSDVIKNINLECRGFEFCPEVTAKIAKQGIKILEVPIKYYPRSSKEGKKIRWRDGWTAIWVLLKYRFKK